MGDGFSFTEGENRGAGTGNRKAERASGERCAFGGVEIRDELLTARLGDDVMDGAGDEAVVFLNQATEKAAEVDDLLGGIFERDFLGQDFAGDFGEDFDVGMDNGRPKVFRRGDLGEVELVIRTNENDAAKETGRDVVGVPCAIGRGLTRHREGQQLFFAQGIADELIHREGTRNRRG